MQLSGDFLMEGGATEQSYRQLREEGQQLLRLTQVSSRSGWFWSWSCCNPALSQVNRSLYGAEESSEAWAKYLDHIDDQVQEGLFQLLLRSLHFLSDHMNPQVNTAGCTWSSMEL